MLGTSHLFSLTATIPNNCSKVPGRQWEQDAHISSLPVTPLLGQDLISSRWPVRRQVNPSFPDGSVLSPPGVSVLGGFPPLWPPSQVAGVAPPS